MLAGKEASGEALPYAGLPGRIVAPNLTPDPQTGAGSWTDDQLARAIREGVGHDGRALFPIMPYQHYRNMSDEDLASVVVYLRSLPAVHHQLPATEIIFPVKYLIRSAPEPIAAPVADVVSSDQLKYGTHLADQAGCVDCHTPQVRGQNVPGMDFAGGFPFMGPWGTVASANITPDPSGIPYYDEALFLTVLRTGQVKARKLSPIMPVMVYRNLTDDDLKAIFAFLRTTKPVKHRVNDSEPPTDVSSANRNTAAASKTCSGSASVKTRSCAVDIHFAARTIFSTHSSVQEYPIQMLQRSSIISLGAPLDSLRKDYEMRKGFTRKPRSDDPATAGKNYITPSGLQRLKDEHRFLLTRERPAVTEVVAWAASNGDRSENADYQYGKRRLRQIDGRIRFLTKRIEAAEVVDPELRERGRRRRGHSSERPCAMPMPQERSEW